MWLQKEDKGINMPNESSKENVEDFEQETRMIVLL